MEIQKFLVGEVIFSEGDQGTLAYILKSGKVKITKIIKDETPRTLVTVGPGSIIGEMALVDDAPRAASAVVLEECEAMVVTQEEFKKRLTKSDPVVVLLLKIYTERLRQQSENIAAHLR